MRTSRSSLTEPTPRHCICFEFSLVIFARHLCSFQRYFSFELVQHLFSRISFFPSQILHLHLDFLPHLTHLGKAPWMLTLRSTPHPSSTHNYSHTGSWLRRQPHLLFLKGDQNAVVVEGWLLGRRCVRWASLLVQLVSVGKRGGFLYIRGSLRKMARGAGDIAGARW